jgi:hypothetical protein
MITAKDFRKVLNAPEFKPFDVSINRNGTIEIKVSNTNNNYLPGDKHGRIYYIGYRPDVGYHGSYWVRQRNGSRIWPMNRNSKVPQDWYWFDSFDDALEYLRKHFNKKYGKPVVEDNALVVDFEMITDINFTPEQEKLMYKNGIAMIGPIAIAVSEQAKRALTDFTIELWGSGELETLEKMFPGIKKYIKNSDGAFNYNTLSK